MSQLQQFFEFLMSKVKEKEDLQETVKKWVGPYDGKILQVITPDHGAQYIFTGEVKFKETMKDGSLEVIGNAHESDPLANLILAAMMGAI